MNSIFFQSWYRYETSLRLFLYISGFQPRIKIRGYNIIRAYGSGLMAAITDKKMIQKLLDKIIQLVIATKPAGQLTCLGLSFSYDIVKARGGNIKVETNSNDNLSDQTKMTTGTKFIIQLPLK